MLTPTNLLLGIVFGFLWVDIARRDEPENPGSDGASPYLTVLPYLTASPYLIVPPYLLQVELSTQTKVE
jgi:hypothetical protein